MVVLLGCSGDDLEAAKDAGVADAQDPVDAGEDPPDAGLVDADASSPGDVEIDSLTWDIDSHQRAAQGSDLWACTWHTDDRIYCGWGDGTGFEAPEKKSWGVSALSGGPGTDGQDVYYGPPGSGQGKILGMVSVDGDLHAWFVPQAAGDNDYYLLSSQDDGLSWEQSSWSFAAGTGSIRFRAFLHLGRGYAGAPSHLGDYVYSYGFVRESDDGTAGRDAYLARVPRGAIRDRAAYEFYSGSGPSWARALSEAVPVYSNPDATWDGSTVRANPAVSFNPYIGNGRYLLTVNHGIGAGQLGVFDGPEPWGPWSAVYLADDWLGIGTDCTAYLSCLFPQKWMFDGGLTMWSVFSIHNGGAVCSSGEPYDDYYNLMRVKVALRSSP